MTGVAGMGTGKGKSPTARRHSAKPALDWREEIRWSRGGNE
ncbi:hypothetical protein [Okeania sp. SIO3I5]|nr:hypothetical protein [Okeania sp. SIO3I5]